LTNLATRTCVYAMASMQGQTADVAEELKKIIGEIREKFDEAGMQVVDALVDTLDEIKSREGDTPEKVLAEMHELFTSFKQKLAEIEADPSCLEPKGIAACTSYYEGRVLDKLKEINNESHDLTESLKGLVSQVEDPMKQFAKTLQQAIEQMEETIKKIVKLPKELDSLSRTVNGSKHMAGVEKGSLRKTLDATGSCPLLDRLRGLKEPLKEAEAKIKHGCQALEEFIMKAPDSIRAAFNLPQPLCFLQSLVIPQAPQAMTELLQIVDKMSKLDMEAMRIFMEKINSMIDKLEPETVSRPIQKFRVSAASHVDKLETLVSGARAEGSAPSKTGGRTTPRSKMSSMRKIFGGA